jgi:hypothetical protein
MWHNPYSILGRSSSVRMGYLVYRPSNTALIPMLNSCVSLLLLVILEVSWKAYFLTNKMKKTRLTEAMILAALKNMSQLFR